jgi:MerR family transcriptional regulator, mercuric resistance operon regulatory protein
MAAAALRTGEVARAAGVNLETLRYYERRGLLAEPRRSSGGHRMYPASAVTVLRVVKAAQRLGFTLQEIAELLDVGRHQHGARSRSQTRVSAQATAKLAEVDAKIADLQLIRDRLHAVLDAGCDDLMTCAGLPSCPVPFEPLAAE